MITLLILDAIVFFVAGLLLGRKTAIGKAVGAIGDAAETIAKGK